MMNFNLHPAQRRVFLDPARFKLLIAGRRAGKSYTMLTTAIAKVLSFNQPINPMSPPVALIVMPSLKACRAIHWESLVRLLESKPFIKQINRTDFRIKFYGDKPDLLIRGADNHGEALRGLKCYWVGIDEVQGLSPKAWYEVLYPALSDTQDSSALLIGTPKGKAHWLYNLSLEAQSSPEWSYHHYYTKDNPTISRAYLREAKRMLPPKVYSQEFRASFEDFDGQILDQLKTTHQISNLPNQEYTYYMAADWGDINCALVIVGLDKHLNKFYAVDSWYQGDGRPITQDEFLSHLKIYANRYNVYRTYLPDDRPSAILSARLVGKREGVRGLERAVQVKRNEIGIMEGLDILNSLLFQDKLFILNKNTQLIEQLQNYHRDTNSSGQLINKPAPNQVDHLIDALRYCVATLYHKIQTRTL
jgi:hypothetical protein